MRMPRLKSSTDADARVGIWTVFPYVGQLAAFPV